MGKILTENGISFELFEEGDKEISGFKVKAFFAAHQPIFDRVMPKNTAFLVNEKFLHPGDSYAQQALDQHPEVLALAVAGPWMNMNEGFEFTQKCNAKAVLPIHDGHIKDFFTSAMYPMWEAELAKQGIKFANLQKPGDSIVLD